MRSSDNSSSSRARAAAAAAQLLGIKNAACVNEPLAIKVTKDVEEEEEEEVRGIRLLKETSRSGRNAAARMSTAPLLHLPAPFPARPTRTSTRINYRKWRSTAAATEQNTYDDDADGRTDGRQASERSNKREGRRQLPSSEP